MRKIIVVILFAAIGCSDRIRAYSDHNPDFEMKDYSTFGWYKMLPPEPGPDSLYNNDVVNRKIKYIIQKQLELRGYELTSEQPEFKIYFHFIVHDQAIVSAEPFGYPYSPSWTRLGSEKFPYHEGTLFLDFMDTKSNNLVWRGWAVCALEADTPSTELDEIIKEATDKIFRKFPNTSKHAFVRDDKI